MSIRSAITGRFVKNSTGKRWPKTTTNEDRTKIAEMQNAIDAAYNALHSTQYVGGLSTRVAYQKAMAALGPLVQYKTQTGQSDLRSVNQEEDGT